MKIKIGHRYRLNAPWHKHHGHEIEVIMRRRGASEAHKGKWIFHIATDPDNPNFRYEDLDTEHVQEEFVSIGFEEITSKIDDTKIEKDLLDVGIKIRFYENDRNEAYIKLIALDDKKYEKEWQMIKANRIGDWLPSVMDKSDDSDNSFQPMSHSYRQLRQKLNAKKETN